MRCRRALGRNRRNGRNAVPAKTVKHVTSPIYLYRGEIEEEGRETFLFRIHRYVRYVRYVRRWRGRARYRCHAPIFLASSNQASVTSRPLITPEVPTRRRDPRFVLRSDATTEPARDPPALPAANRLRRSAVWGYAARRGALPASTALLSQRSSLRPPPDLQIGPRLVSVDNKPGSKSCKDTFGKGTA